jgi:hypothetical protein
MYQVFVRDWWQENPAWPNGLEPRGDAPKHKVGRPVDTVAEAREACADYMHRHQHSARDRRLGRKAEFESL